MSVCEAITGREAENEAILLMVRRRITNKEIARRLGLSIHQIHHRLYGDLKAKRPPVIVKELKHLNLYIDGEVVDAVREIAQKEGVSLNRYVCRMILDVVQARAYATPSGLSGRRTPNSHGVGS